MTTWNWEGKVYISIELADRGHWWLIVGGPLQLDVTGTLSS